MLIERIKFYLSKAKAAWRSGTFAERLARKLKTNFFMFFLVLWRYINLNPSDRKLNVKDAFADHRNTVSNKNGADADIEIFERLSKAYAESKRDQRDLPSHFQIRGLWKEWLDVNYRPLVDAMSQGNSNGAKQILENFCREQIAVGTGASYDDWVKYKFSLLGSMYITTVWCDYRDKLLESGFDLSTLSYPLIGNPAGFFHNRTYIQIETLRHAYKAHCVRLLLRDVPSPVIVEIGGGFGGQAYQFISQHRENGNPLDRYINFDIPEVLIVVGYFLLKSFPHMKVCLYGEESINSDYTIGIFPFFAIDHLSDMSADMVFNSNSFSEMDSECVSHYISVVNRVCRKYFMHVNHETPLEFQLPDGTVSRNMIGSRIVPDTTRFKRIYKVPRIFGRPEDLSFRSYSYLYERMSAV